jgi:uncharacterized protein
MTPVRDSGPRKGDRFWDRLSAASVERPWALIACGAALFLLSMPFAVRLYGDLRTDLRELLPQGAPAAVGLQELEKRIGGLASLAVVVRTDDLKAGERLVDALAASLRALPSSMVSGVFYRIDEERDFFEAHGALYAEEKDLVQVRDALVARKTEATRKANPLVVDLDEEEPAKAGEKPAAADQAGLDAGLQRLRAAFSKVDHYIDGYLAGEGGRTLIVLVKPPGSAVSLDDNQRLFGTVETMVKELKPASFHPSIRIGYGGEVRSVIEAQEALVRDLLVSTILVLSTVAVALLLYYRAWRAIPLLVLPLFAGVAGTFALSRGVIHYLNPNTAFLGSIIIGNGINAGIILLARYFEERRRGASVDIALPIALKTTWLGTFAASAAAAASYGSLGAVSFRGFNQFGFMGLAGMLICWVTTYLLMPPLIAVAERVRPLRERRRSRITGWVAAPYARALTRYPRSAVIASLVLTALAVVGLVRFVREPIDYDFRHLGSRAGLKDGAAFWDSHVDAVLQSYQTPTVVMTESTQKAQTVASALEAAKENPASLGDVAGLSDDARKSAAETIDSVSTLQKLVPDHQQRKIDLLQEIFRIVAPPAGSPGLIDPRVLKALPEDLRPTLLRLREKTKLVPVSLADVPRRLVQPFVERDGHRGRLVLVYPTLETDSKHGRAQILHAKLVRGVASKVDPGSLVAGQIVLTSDIIDAITGDGGFAALLSFVAVAVLTIVVMRSLRGASWVLGSLCLGVLGMFGALGALSLRLNFVNFAVLPITFGIGVDYAVNFYQRYRQSDCVEDAVAAAGGAVTLCSATTIIGYATLVTADNMAIQSFGLTAVIGELTCLSAALFALPALLAFGDRRRTDRAPEAPRVAPTPAPATLPAEPRGEAQGL